MKRTTIILGLGAVVAGILIVSARRNRFPEFDSSWMTPNGEVDEALWNRYVALRLAKGDDV